MARVRMYHAGGDRYQFASEAAFQAEHRHEGWALAEDQELLAPEPEPAEPEPAPAEQESANNTRRPRPK